MNMCGQNADKWSGSKSYPQYLNPDTASCVALDLDRNGNIMSDPITGRSPKSTSGCYPA